MDQLEDEDDVTPQVIAPTLAVVSEQETMEFFSEGLKQAASAAMELSVAQSHPIWEDISALCLEMRKIGIDLSQAKPLSRFDALAFLDKKEKVMIKNLEEKSPSKKFIIH